LVVAAAEVVTVTRDVNQTVCSAFAVVVALAALSVVVSPRAATADSSAAIRSSALRAIWTSKPLVSVNHKLANPRS